jgi:hypothetical protein
VARLSCHWDVCSFGTFLAGMSSRGPEPEGLGTIIRGMQLALPDDEALTHHTDALYDGLYTYLRWEVL